MAPTWAGPGLFRKDAVFLEKWNDVMLGYQMSSIDAHGGLVFRAKNFR